MPTTTLLDLDDDCLVCILQYLTIYELIEAEKVCEEFKIACQRIYLSKKFHKLRIELRYLRIEYFKDICDRIGPALRSFEFSGGYIMDREVKKVLTEGISELCPKLKILSINYIQFTVNEFQTLHKCFRNLKYLDLSRCSLDSLESVITLNGDELCNIKTLKVAGNGFSGAFFKNMKHVETLDVSYCFQIDFDVFTEFLKNCIKLICLDLTGSCKLISAERNILDQILIHQPNIESITFDCAGEVKDYDFMKSFTHLKHYSFDGRPLGT